jgi:hypothetical protein
MREIPLTKGKVAIVDDKDYEWLSQYNWCYSTGGTPPHRGYASRGVFRGGKNTMTFMHREIMNTPKGMQTDHINGDPLDNRRENLRICNASQNKANVGLIRINTSGYKGVSWMKEKKKWRAFIGGGKFHHIGLFVDPREAARAYDSAAKELFGEFALLNFPEEISVR